MAAPSVYVAAVIEFPPRAGTLTWDVLVLPKEIPIDELPHAFADVYHEVPAEAAKAFAREVLNFHAVQAHAMRFFERKTPQTPPQPGLIARRAIEDSLKTAAPHCFFDHQNGVEFHLAVSIPYASPSGKVPMNEFMAMYAAMYFFSSLVRYHADYLDSIGEHKDAWLIESFAKSAPLHLLKYSVSAILGYTLLIESA